MGLTGTVSNEYSNIGNSSFKLITNGNTSFWVRIEATYETSGNSLTLTLKILNTDDQCSLWIYQLDNNGTDLKHESITVPASDNVQDATFTVTTETNIKTFRSVISANSSNPQTIYIDNICLKEA